MSASLDPQSGSSDGDPDARASEAILGALRSRSGSLGGAAGSPADDGRLSERILSEARARSARIAGGGQGGSTASGRPIPWWLWLGWLVALAAAAIAWWRLL